MVRHPGVDFSDSLDVCLDHLTYAQVVTDALIDDTQHHDQRTHENMDRMTHDHLTNLTSALSQVSYDSARLTMHVHELLATHTHDTYITATAASDSPTGEAKRQQGSLTGGESGEAAIPDRHTAPRPPDIALDIPTPPLQSTSPLHDDLPDCTAIHPDTRALTPTPIPPPHHLNTPPTPPQQQPFPTTNTAHVPCPDTEGSRIWDPIAEGSKAARSRSEPVGVEDEQHSLRGEGTQHHDTHTHIHRAPHNAYPTHHRQPCNTHPPRRGGWTIYAYRWLPLRPHATSRRTNNTPEAPTPPHATRLHTHAWRWLYTYTRSADSSWSALSPTPIHAPPHPHQPTTGDEFPTQRPPTRVHDP